MTDRAKFPIHGTDPEGGSFRHPGKIRIEFVDENRVETKDAKTIPIETAFKKVEGRYRAVICIKVFGTPGDRRLESYDADGNLIATVLSPQAPLG